MKKNERTKLCDSLDHLPKRSLEWESGIVCWMRLKDAKNETTSD